MKKAEIQINLDERVGKVGGLKGFLLKQIWPLVKDLIIDLIIDLLEGAKAGRRTYFDPSTSLRVTGTPQDDNADAIAVALEFNTNAKSSDKKLTTTLDECRDEVAKQYGYYDWNDLKRILSDMSIGASIIKTREKEAADMAAIRETQGYRDA